MQKKNTKKVSKVKDADCGWNPTFNKSGFKAGHDVKVVLNYDKCIKSI